MFHNVLMTSLTPLRDTNEITCWDNRPFNTMWPREKQEKIKNSSVKKIIKKKNKRNRTMFTTEQVRALEKEFSKTKYIDIDRRREIAVSLQIEEKCIKIWFQNRRMKEKRDLSESSESASESASNSVSPPLDNHVYDHGCLQQFHAQPQQEYYYAHNSYISSAVPQYQQSIYDPYHSSFPQYVNYNNDFNPNSEYFSPQPFIYQYNGDAVQNQFENSNSNVHNWPVNGFDSSYL